MQLGVSDGLDGHGAEGELGFERDGAGASSGYVT